MDPHLHSAADTGPKWAGLARWAQTRPTGVRRVVAVIKMIEQLRLLDLTKTDTADRLDQATTKPDIEALFAERGANF